MTELLHKLLLIQLSPMQIPWLCCCAQHFLTNAKVELRAMAEEKGMFVTKALLSQDEKLWEVILTVPG